MPPALWMAVARAGALLALAMAFRLAGRLGGRRRGGRARRRGRGGRAVPHPGLVPVRRARQRGAAGGGPDAVGGGAAPGRAPGHALVLGLLACLLRPELVPFLGLYGAWAWCAEPRLRPLLAGALVLLPAGLGGPRVDRLGQPARRRRAGAQRAGVEPVAGRAALAAGARARSQPRGRAVELLALTARGRRARAAPRRGAVLAAAALAEVALFVAMTQAGFSGNPRYVLPALALLCVLAGVGAARRLVRAAAAARPARRPGSPACAGWRSPCWALRSWTSAPRCSPTRRARSGERMRAARATWPRAVDRVGGPGAVAAIGTATANRALQPRLAWELERADGAAWRASPTIA